MPDGPMTQDPTYDDFSFGFDDDIFGEDEDTWLDEALSGLGGLDWEQKPEGVDFGGLTDETTAAMDVLNQSMGGFTEKAESAVKETRKEREAPQTKIGEGELPDDKPTGKQAFLKGIANFLTVFTSKDPGQALMSLVQMRLNQREADKQREFQLRTDDLKHRRALEAEHNRHLQAKDYLAAQSDEMRQSQAWQNEQGLMSRVAYSAIDHRFQTAMNNAGLNNQADFQAFQKGLEAVMAEFNFRHRQEGFSQMREDKFRQVMMMQAQTGAPQSVLEASERIYRGTASPEDYKEANRYQDILNNMTSQQLYQRMKQQYVSQYLNLEQARATGQIGEQEFFYSVEGLGKAYENLGFGGVSTPSQVKLLEQYGINSQGLDQWQQKVVFAGAKMLMTGKVPDYQSLLTEINNAGFEEWGHMPELKKKKVLEVLQQFQATVNFQLDQQIQDRQMGGPQWGEQGKLGGSSGGGGGGAGGPWFPESGGPAPANMTPAGLANRAVNKRGY